MKFSFTFCHMDSSDALESYTRRKLQHVTQRLLPPFQLMEVIFASNLGRHSCRVNFVLKGHTYHLHEQGSYMYDCVDRVADKVQTILKKHMGKNLGAYRSVAMKQLYQEKKWVEPADGDE